MIEKLRKHVRGEFRVADFNSWTQVFWYAVYILVGTGKPLKIELKGLLETVQDAITLPNRPSSLNRED